MPVRNGMRFLANAQASILANSRSFDQIVIVNDNSTDGTSEFCGEWEKVDNRVLLVNNPNEGLVSSLNLGLKESANRLVARFDVDDRYIDSRISEQVEAFDSTTSALFTDYCMNDTLGNSLGYFPSPIFPPACSVSLISNRRTAHPTVLFDKIAVIDAGAYREQDFLVEDLSLWIRLARNGLLKSIPRMTTHYLMNSNGVTSQHRLQMLKQKRVLLGELGLNTNDVLICFQKLEEHVASYSEVPHGDWRTVLHIQELVEASKLCNELKPNLSQLMRKLPVFFNSKNIWATIELNRDRRQRKRLRSS
jgi:glycosyltransferase involved in cell wall biosynthesis